MWETPKIIPFTPTTAKMEIFFVVITTTIIVIAIFGIPRQTHSFLRGFSGSRFMSVQSTWESQEHLHLCFCPNWICSFPSQWSHLPSGPILLRCKVSHLVSWMMSLRLVFYSSTSLYPFFSATVNTLDYHTCSNSSKSLFSAPCQLQLSYFKTWIKKKS